MRKMTKILSLVTMVVMLFSITANAAQNEQPEDQKNNYVILNGETAVYEGQDWENPETGEYFRWSNTRGVDKSFSFKIRNSVESSKFTVSGSSVTITCYAAVKNSQGVIVPGYENHRYRVELKGIFSRALDFRAQRNASGSISGLVNGGSYSVKITNMDSISSSVHYLVGEGRVVS